MKGSGYSPWAPAAQAQAPVLGCSLKKSCITRPKAVDVTQQKGQLLILTRCAYPVGGDCWNTQEALWQLALSAFRSMASHHPTTPPEAGTIKNDVTFAWTANAEIAH